IASSCERSPFITYESNPAPLWSNFLCVLVPLTVNFKVIGPDHPIMVSAGEDALLPCHLFRNTSVQKMEVRWYRSKFSEPVHLYQNEKDQAEQQIPNYQGRTELLKDGIVDGSIVLRIRNITPSDHGQFICFFRSSRFYAEATLELKVTANRFQCVSLHTLGVLFTSLLCKNCEKIYKYLHGNKYLIMALQSSRERCNTS
uniref:Ig-like domain-containing protein n=1 Tax=Terrapene triunguis TaxID=2587831 RepID=A0A674INY3_9SAUR